MTVTDDLVTGTDGAPRCWWCGTDEEYQRYHDEEWGVPQHDSRALFEKLCLEGFQAGLSWLTILRRREAFREAFCEFDPERVALMGSGDIERLLTNPAIIRHRGKIEATIVNARATLSLSEPLSTLLWRFAPDTEHTRPRNRHEILPHSPESAALSKTLRAAGFRFVGPTTLYALMQSMGMVDDHLTGCFRATQQTATPTEDEREGPPGVRKSSERPAAEHRRPSTTAHNPHRQPR